MRRVFVLVNNSGIGGTERRMGRLFARMVMADPEAVLIINAGLWAKLTAAGLVTGHEERVWLLPEPWGRLAGGLGLGQGGLAFLVRKLDYVLFALMVLGRYGPAAPRLFHAVLGGAYVMLPLMVCRPDHRVAISMVSPDLGMMVGPPWAVAIYRFALVRCAAIDALTESARVDLIQRGLSDGKILVSDGSVVDVDHFHPAPEKEPWVVFAGRLVEEKNPLLFVEAVPAVLEAVPSARFFLLGEGPLAPFVERALDRLNLRGVAEIGFRSDPAPVLSKARVFVSLQREDNYPSQSLLEAMACGAAAVATDVGFTWKLVDDTTGIRVKPDSARIAEAVIGLLKDPARCARLGRAARQRVEGRHTEKVYRGHLDRLYAQAVT
jgi:glycosyltransferase involved in cell wall biosynthesis